MNDQIEVIELRSWWIEKIRRHAAGRAVQHRGKLRQRDRAPRKLSSGATPLDDLLDRVARYLGVGQWCELNNWPGGRRKICHPSAAAPSLPVFLPIERRRRMHLTHQRIVYLALRERHGFEGKRTAF